MMTIFKIFNTKTKEVKEYNKPEFGDFGEFVIIRGAKLEYCGESLSECQLHEANQCYTQDNRELKYDELIAGDDITAIRFFKNTDHELNTLFNGLFKNCVYSNGDFVGVLQYCFEYNGKIYKVGDMFSLFYSRGKENKVYDSELRLLSYDGFSFVDNWFKNCYTKNQEDIGDIHKYKTVSNLDDTIDKKYLLCNLSNINREWIKNIGNLLDEHFAGGEKLANIFNL